VGAAVATLGLTGTYWLGDLQTTTAVAATDDSTTATTVAGSVDTYDEDDFDFEDDSFDDESVDVVPSAAASDTSSRAS
jgi:hypothetical protein